MSSDRALIDRVLYGFDRDVIQWVGQRIPGLIVTPSARALGVALGEDLAAGVVYDQFNGVNIMASIAVDDPRAQSRAVARRLLEYPFVTLGCKSITVWIASTNLPSLNLAARIGFKPEAMIRYAAPDGSTLVVMKMLREECRWIGDRRDGIEGRERAAGA